MAPNEWKEKAITAIIDALLDPDDNRSRDRVSHEGSPEIYITEPADRSYDGMDVFDEPIDRGHLMTLDEELRWIPAATHSKSYNQSLDDFSYAQMLNQTRDVDKTTKWDWAALRRSRIRFSVAALRVATLARPKSVDELAIDRADMRNALKKLSRGELRAVILRFAGCPLKSGERVQLMRAMRKSRELRKRIRVPLHIVSEEVVCPPSEISNEKNGGLDAA